MEIQHAVRVLWTWQWTPAAPGKYTLMVRIINGKGELQKEKKQGTVPDGAKGYEYDAGRGCLVVH
ncbi:MAG: hypothetical protein PVS3B3_33240 [Ktedonobacteraceae bacterium]